MRLIDADALEKEGWVLHRTIKVNEHTSEYQTKPLAKIQTVELEQPEIIRCKECKFYTSIQKHSMNLKIGICSLSSRYIGDDGFCSEAGRRTDG